MFNEILTLSPVAALLCIICVLQFLWNYELSSTIRQQKIRLDYRDRRLSRLEQNNKKLQTDIEISESARATFERFLASAESDLKLARAHCTRLEKAYFREAELRSQTERRLEQAEQEMECAKQDLGCANLECARLREELAMKVVA